MQHRTEQTEIIRTIFFHPSFFVGLSVYEQNLHRQKILLMTMHLLSQRAQEETFGSFVIIVFFSDNFCNMLDGLLHQLLNGN